MSDKGQQSGPAPACAMSVDVEDYFQAWAFSDVIARRSWDGFERRVGAATRVCLDLLDRSGARATFFTLGWVGEREPALLREIVARGHELASHGYDHTRVDAQTPAAFRTDIRHAKRLLEDVAGVPVRGYRAASFSIGPKTPWAHEILAEEGYRYSSSTHPILHDQYGDARGRRSPWRPVAGADFLEAPVATAEVMGWRVPCAGGGWFRAAPLGLSRRLLARAGRQTGGPVIFYIHPWELDPGQPRIARARRRSRLRHYLNLDGTQGKWERLLARSRWDRIDSALGLEAPATAAIA